MDFNQTLAKIQESELTINLLDIEPNKTAIEHSKKIAKLLGNGEVDKIIDEYLTKTGVTKKGKMNQMIKNQLFKNGLITKKEAMGPV